MHRLRGGPEDEDTSSTTCSRRPHCGTALERPALTGRIDHPHLRGRCGRRCAPSSGGFDRARASLEATGSRSSSTRGSRPSCRCSPHRWAVGAVFVPVNPVPQVAITGCPRRRRQRGSLVLSDHCPVWLGLSPVATLEGREDAPLRHVVLVDGDGGQRAEGAVNYPSVAPRLTAGRTGTGVDALAAPCHRRGHGGDPLYLGEHRQAQGRRAESTATWWRRVERRAYLGNGAEDLILAALPLSFDAGFSQLTTAFAAGAHVVLINYLLPRDIVTLCARARRHRADLRAAAVDPAGRPDVAGEAASTLRYFANTGGRMPRPRSTSSARLPAGAART